MRLKLARYPVSRELLRSGETMMTRSILRMTFAVLCLMAVTGVSRNHVAAPALCAEDRPASTEAKDAADAENKETPTQKLLQKLREQNAGKELFTEPWLMTLKQIADLGPDAVPELIAELEATQDDRMLRCLGFLFRAIGDRRSVPALIRAIPKTLRPGASDMGLRATDPDLLKFAQANDLDARNEAYDYGFGRPVREIFGALQKLTGQQFSEEDLYHIFLEGSPAQLQRKRVLYERVALEWAGWWELNWKDFVQDEQYSKVNLKVMEDEGPILPPSPNSHFKTGGLSTNWILESVLNPQAKRVFYDFDAGRASALPEKWRKAESIESHLDEIMVWAMREGFDLMGTEYVTAEGRRIYSLRSIGMHAWELGKQRWKMNANNLTLEELKSEGRPAEKLLLHFNVETKSIEPLETATYLFITRHGTPGLLFVGVEVQDDSLKPGGIANGDDELRPISFFKGRRFGFTSLEEIK